MHKGDPTLLQMGKLKIELGLIDTLSFFKSFSAFKILQNNKQINKVK